MKTNRTPNKDLDFVRKHCLGGTYPASDERCPYAKAKLQGASDDFEQPDGIFLCRYPDEKMPTHQAWLISDLNECPNTARKKRNEMLDLETALSAVVAF